MEEGCLGSCFPTLAAKCAARMGHPFFVLLDGTKSKTDRMQATTLDLQAKTALFASNGLVQRCDELDGEYLVIRLVVGSVVFVFVAGFDELQPVGAKACRRLKVLLFAAYACGGEAGPERQVPAWAQHLLDFDVFRRFAKCWNDCVGHDKPLSLTLHAGVSMRPTHIEADSVSRQSVGIRFSWVEVFILAVEVWPAISGNADAETLANGVAGASGPVTVLVFCK